MMNLVMRQASIAIVIPYVAHNLVSSVIWMLSTLSMNLVI